jgi:hypothetical protein
MTTAGRTIVAMRWMVLATLVFCSCARGGETVSQAAPDAAADRSPMPEPQPELDAAVAQTCAFAPWEVGFQSARVSLAGTLTCPEAIHGSVVALAPGAVHVGARLIPDSYYGPVVPQAMIWTLDGQTVAARAAPLPKSGTIEPFFLLGQANGDPELLSAGEGGLYLFASGNQGVGTPVYPAAPTLQVQAAARAPDGTLFTLIEPVDARMVRGLLLGRRAAGGSFGVTSLADGPALGRAVLAFDGAGRPAALWESFAKEEIRLGDPRKLVLQTEGAMPMVLAAEEQRSLAGLAALGEDWVVVFDWPAGLLQRFDRRGARTKALELAPAQAVEHRCEPSVSHEAWCGGDCQHCVERGDVVTSLQVETPWPARPVVAYVLEHRDREYAERRVRLYKPPSESTAYTLIADRTREELLVEALSADPEGLARSPLFRAELASWTSSPSVFTAGEGGRLAVTATDRFGKRVAVVVLEVAAP